MTFAIALLLAAQIGGTPINGGNPTPGTPQPEPPSVADRITVTGCVQLANDAPKATPDSNTVLESRYVLAAAEEPAKVQFKLAAIESQLSPFAGARVELSGEPKAPGSNVLQVEFVRKLVDRCR